MKTVVISDFAHERQKEGGRKGSAARHDPRTYARSIVKRWPDLTEEQRSEVRSILAPIVGRVAEGAR